MYQLKFHFFTKRLLEKGLGQAKEGLPESCLLARKAVLGRVMRLA
jgi:hypothetical protein